MWARTGVATLAVTLLVAQLATAQDKKTSDASFWVATSSVAALTVADIELSQSCMRKGTCSEASPFVPKSRAQAYALQAPFLLGTSYLAYRLKHHGAKAWWLPQVGLMAGHGVGVASGLRFVF